VELRKNATFTFSDQLFSILLAAVAAKTPTPSADDTKAKTSAKSLSFFSLKKAQKWSVSVFNIETNCLLHNHFKKWCNS
jgi:hypothetical protein